MVKQPKIQPYNFGKILYGCQAANINHRVVLKDHQARCYDQGQACRVASVVYYACKADLAQFKHYVQYQQKEQVGADVRAGASVA